MQWLEGSRQSSVFVLVLSVRFYKDKRHLATFWIFQLASDFFIALFGKGWFNVHKNVTWQRGATFAHSHICMQRQSLGKSCNFILQIDEKNAKKPRMILWCQHWHSNKWLFNVRCSLICNCHSHCPTQATASPHWIRAFVVVFFAKAHEFQLIDSIKLTNRRDRNEPKRK